jgi:hypothetical protein
MNPWRTVIYSAAASVALVTLAVAQTTPQPDTTSPSAASSPHQRDATSAQTPETPANSGSNPAAASSPHQAQVTTGTQADKSDAKQAMKACVTQKQADNTGMSAMDAKKSCKEQLKASPR